MKKINFVIIILIYLITANTLSARYKDIPVTRDLNPDRKYISYEEYLELHPFRPTEYSEINRVSSNQREEGVLIIVESDLYPEITDAIATYQNDLVNEGYNSFLVEFSGTMVFDMKIIMMLYYQEDNVRSVILIGDLPVAWFEMFEDWNNNGIWDPDENWVDFPIELYFSDIDGVWQDNDNNGIYDYHEGDKHPEIGIGRIKASNMSFLSSSEAELINGYFQRNHLYRNGFLQNPDIALAYIDDDWAYWGPEYQDAMQFVYPETELINEINQTTAEDYRTNRLTADYEFIQVHVHSGPDAHYFYENNGNNYNTVTNYQISYLNPTSYFYNLFACSNSRFTENNNMGGMYLLGNDYCLGTIGSTKTGSMLWFEDFYEPLSLDENLGEALRQWWELSVDVGDDWMWQRAWFYGMAIQGDPSLKVTYEDNVVFVPDDYPTIQEAINAVENGDIVLVNPGTYVENINYNGKNITVASLFYTTQDISYISQTIIEGCYISFENEEDSTAVLNGLTIRGCELFVLSSGPKLESCYVKENYGYWAIFCTDQSNPIIKSCTITNNRFGSGITLYNSSAKIINTLFYDNGTGWGGAGLDVSNSNVIIQNSTFYDNWSEYNGAALYCSGNSNVIINNTLMWDNFPCNIYSYGQQSEISISYSCLEDGQNSITSINSIVNWLEGNIDSDPSFVNPDDGDFHLQDTSPCIGAGIDEIEINGNWYYAPLFDIEGNPRPDPAGSMPDMGAYENPLGEPQVGITQNQLPSTDHQLTNYPNPFNPATTIKFTTENTEKNTELIIYNIKGQKVRTFNSHPELVEGSIIWDGTDENNQPVSSGIYFYKLKTDKFSQTRKMLLMK